MTNKHIATYADIEDVARQICKLRGIDPDALVFVEGEGMVREWEQIKTHADFVIVSNNVILPKRLRTR